MRIIHVENLNQKMKLAKPVYHQDRLLLNTGCDNLQNYKSRLLELGINYIYINDKMSQDIEIPEIINSETRKKGIITIKKTLKNISNNKKINIKEVKLVVKDIIDDILNNQNILVNLSYINDYDSYTFSHSVNVAVLSLILGKNLGYNSKKLLQLGVGALLHDIGKVSIPEEILKKKGKLTDKEFKIIQKHPALGYKNLKIYNQISPLSRTIILHHHEKVNGSGYPKGLKQNQLHEFIRIVTIADVFDALTSDRCYRNKWPIAKAVELLISNSNTEFDADLVNKFIQNIAIYPNGTLVKLSNGQTAIVKEQNNDFPTRPVIKIVKDKLGNELKEYQEINLITQHNITIVSDEGAKKLG
ncbi:HD-GYP domain-containing protein [Orenia marismortui]|uniref:HD-GYP domain-containing protein n=1 Tax=Orenia marismortui TaxID=46469 RepID=UPI0003763A12|nr:HD-GYP domain-containing protein [Orenia marismortui]